MCGMCSRGEWKRYINVLMRGESCFGSKRVLFNACYVKGGLEGMAVHRCVPER